MSNLPVVLLGAGGFSCVLRDIVVDAGHEVAGTLSKHSAGNVSHNELPDLGSDDELQKPDFVARHRFVLAVGDLAVRARLIRKMEECGAVQATVVHPSATVSPTARIGEGVVVAEHANINAGAVIAKSSFLNAGCHIGHDAQIGQNGVIHANAVVGGDVVCAENVHVGPGAVLLRGIKLGANCTVGAGTVVIQSLQSNMTVYAAPPRIL